MTQEVLERSAPQSLFETFERQVRRRPDAVATTFADEEATYAELAAVAGGFARSIGSRISGTEPLVGICIPRGLEMIASVLGVLKAGAAYLPLDPDLPETRLRQIVEEARPGLVVTLGSHAARLGAIGAPLLVLETWAQRLAHADPEDPAAAPAIGPQSLAYVLYTSGSTGRPKGVEVTHGSVLNVLASYRCAPGMDERDVVLALARISFDVSVLEILLPLSCGARVVLLPQSATRDPFALAREIERRGVTVIQGPPALWTSLLETGWRGNARLRIWSGGEVLTRALADRLLPLCRELWNAYGPTETTIVSTLHRVSPGAGDVPIGGPIADTTLQVLDEEMRPTPDGREGELYIGGAGVARGYRGRPDLTGERFTGEAGRRLYRTGDLVRRDPQGRLHFVGRADGQVKLRGFRVETGEVEAVIAAHAAVSACAVRAWPDAVGQNALVAYVVPRSRSQDGTTEIRAHVAARLPDYMVPQRIVLIDRLPLTPNAKLDRAALPNPFEAASDDRTLAARPADGSTREALEALWKSLLGPVALTPEADFFDLGGYSLLTVRLLLEIEDRFSRSLSLPELLAHSTLERMTALVEGGTGDPISRRLLVIREGGSRPPLYWTDAGPLLRRALALIGNDTPVFGLSLAPEDEQALSMTDLDAVRLASAVVNVLTGVADRDRPFSLGGWCRWGIVAFEAARQLRELGYSVSTVVLLDADLPMRPPWWRGRKARARRWMARVLPSSHVDTPAPPPPQSFSDRVGAAAAAYKAGVYEGAVAHIQPEEKRGVGRAMAAWRTVVRGPLTVRRSPGDHVGMVREPHCATLGRVIGEALSASDGASDRGPTP